MYRRGDRDMEVSTKEVSKTQHQIHFSILYTRSHHQILPGLDKRKGLLQFLVVIVSGIYYRSI